MTIGTKGHYVTYFLLGGTDTNWQSFEGITPLHLACEQGNVKAVVMLLENGADPNLHDHMDTYPIFTGMLRVRILLPCLFSTAYHPE